MIPNLSRVKDRHSIRTAFPFLCLHPILGSSAYLVQLAEPNVFPGLWVLISDRIAEAAGLVV